jgi:hypothetical protein
MELKAMKLRSSSSHAPPNPLHGVESWLSWRRLQGLRLRFQNPLHGVESDLRNFAEEYTMEEYTESVTWS